MIVKGVLFCLSSSISLNSRFRTYAAELTFTCTPTRVTVHLQYTHSQQLHCLLFHSPDLLLLCAPPTYFPCQLRTRLADPLKTGAEGGSASRNMILAEMEILKKELRQTPSTAVNIVDWEKYAAEEQVPTDDDMPPLEDGSEHVSDA
jgi:hypothetical protein